MEAPQSPVDILPIETELRRLDDRLRIVWNPNANPVRPGYIDAMGRVEPPIFDGRWEIWITAGALDGEPSLLWTWGTELGPERPYRPISWATVEFFKEWDSQNRDVINEHIRRREAYDASLIEQERQFDEGREEVAARFATDVLGAKEFIGVGTDFTPVGSPTQPLKE